MFRASAILVLCTCSGLAFAETHGDTQSMGPQPTAGAALTQEGACAQLSAMGASLKNDHPNADLMKRATDLADICGTSIIPSCQTAFRTWKLKAPDSKFQSLDGCQDVSSLHLSPSCAQTLSQTIFTDKQIAQARYKLRELEQDLRTKGSQLYAKKKGCPEAYYQQRIKEDKDVIKSLQDENVRLQSESDRYAKGYFKNTRFYSRLVAEDAKAMHDWIFLGVGPGPGFSTKGEYLTDTKTRIQNNLADIKIKNADLVHATGELHRDSRASLEEMQNRRDQAYDAYISQLELVRAFDTTQKDLLSHDTTCSPEERDKIQDEEYDRTGGIGGIAAMDAEDMELDLAHLEEPVVIDGYAQNIHEYGCSIK